MPGKDNVCLKGKLILFKKKLSLDIDPKQFRLWVLHDAFNDCLKIKCKMKSPVFIKIACTLTITFWTGFAFSQPVIKVTGSKDVQMIEQQVKWFLNHLDVQENLHLTVIISTKMPEKLKGITISLPSPKPDKYQIIKVRIDAKLSKTKRLLVLAHEMIHVKQYAKNELITLNEKRVIWKGKKHYYARAYNLKTPWEKEAYQADLTLARLVKTSQNQMQEILAEQVPNHTANTSQCKGVYVSGKCKTKTQNEFLTFSGIIQF